jgi:hypothetical protein
MTDRNAKRYLGKTLILSAVLRYYSSALTWCINDLGCTIKVQHRPMHLLHCTTLVNI